MRGGFIVTRMFLQGAVLIVSLLLTPVLCLSGDKSIPSEDVAIAEHSTITLTVPLADSLFWKVPVAVVNEEPVTVKDLKDAVEVSGKPPEDSAAREQWYADLVKRLVTTVLIADEAREMGIDQLPEVTKTVESFEREQLVDLLLAEQVKDIKADNAEVEKTYRDMVTDYKLTSLVFDNEATAKKIRKEIEAGTDFDKVVEQVTADGTAKAVERSFTAKVKDLLPEVAKAVSSMEPGTVSPVIWLPSAKAGGFAIIRLEEVKRNDDPKAREEARNQVIARKKNMALQSYHSGLAKKYVKVNEKLVDAVDFESAKPGFQKLLKDKRVLAQVKGQKPVTVGDLAEAFKYKYFHGLDEAIKNKKVNKQKKAALGELIGRRVLRAEALRQGIDKTDEYKRMVKNYERTIIFSTFLQKVIAPEIAVSMEETKQYYDDHPSEFTYPEMLRVYSLAFAKAEDAQNALEALQKGAEFSWVKSTADGQITEADKNLIVFDGTPILTDTLSKGLQKTLTGVHSEDYRLYKAEDGRFYVLYIGEVIPKKLQPFEEAGKSIQQKLFGEKVKGAIDQWGDKLRKSSDVRVFVAEAPGATK